MYSKYAVIRDQKGYNDLMVAKETGIPQSTIYDWKQRTEKCTDEKKPALSVENLWKIAKLFDVSIEDLLK